MPLDFSYLNQFQRPAPVVDPVEIWNKAKDANLVRKANEADFQYKRELLKDQTIQNDLKIQQQTQAAALQQQKMKDQQELGKIHAEIYSMPDQTPDQIDSAILRESGKRLSAPGYLEVQDYLTKQKQAHATITKDLAAEKAATYGRAASLIDEVSQLPPEQRVQKWPEFVQRFRAIDPSAQVADAPYDDASLALFKAGYLDQEKRMKSKLDAQDLRSKTAAANVAEGTVDSKIAQAGSEATEAANKAVTSAPDPKTGLTKEQQAKLSADMLTGDYKNYLLAVPEGQRGMKPFDAWLSEDANRKKANTNVNVGTFQLAEDGSGNPVLFNSKTGEIKPTDLKKSGTTAKAEEKIAPLRDAISYGSDYLKGGTYTGPGDEALLEKYFELAKPSTGFRMTQAQMDMLSHSRSLIGSAAANIHHAMYGTWFTDKQREEIVKSMHDLAKAKGMGETGDVDPDVKAYADQYFGGDVKKAQEAIAKQK